MGKAMRGRRGIASRQCRPSPYAPSPYSEMNSELSCRIVKKDWEDARCSVCMEFPHKAVLLLCSSHENGCRPYMCGTSFRYSNCLEQYRKAYTRATAYDPESTELACPLCRGRVKGWTVVEPARRHLDTKKRGCAHDECPFVGTFRELRRHVRSEHPSAKPQKVDASLEHRWRMMELERERADVISTIRSTNPGALVFGDYVIEGNQINGVEMEEEDEEEEEEYEDREMMDLNYRIDRGLMSVFLFLQAM
ncbi:hypothetical protein M569_14166, partial [Genlisea aurea]